MSESRFIEAMGNDADIEGLAESVRRVFDIACEVETLDAVEDPRIRFEDDSDAMAHAFDKGLAMYVRGFVDSKVDGTLRVIDSADDSDRS